MPDPGPARLLFGDSIIAFLLLNDARHRIVARVFGVSREDSNLVTTAAIGSVANGLQGGAARVRGARVRPTVFELGVGGALVKETTHRVAGDWSRTTPLFGALIAVVVLEKSLGPALRGSARGVRSSVHGGMTLSRGVRALVGGR